MEQGTTFDLLHTGFNVLIIIFVVTIARGIYKIYFATKTSVYTTFAQNDKWLSYCRERIAMAEKEILIVADGHLLKSIVTKLKAVDFAKIRLRIIVDAEKTEKWIRRELAHSKSANLTITTVSHIARSKLYFLIYDNRHVSFINPGVRAFYVENSSYWKRRLTELFVLLPTNEFAELMKWPFCGWRRILPLGSKWLYLQTKRYLEVKWS